MVYKWKFASFGIDAQIAGEEFERINNKYGRINPKIVVDESRSEEAVLHTCFDWDDKTAAEKYRRVQASDMIRAIVVIEETKEQKPIQVRAFVSTEYNKYEPIHVVVNEKEKMEYVLESAKKELIQFKKKYENLVGLKGIFEEIEKFLDEE